MHKKFTFFVVLTLLMVNYSCSNKKQDNSGNAVKFHTINGDDCHNCFGKLVVSKGSLVDTIKDGVDGLSRGISKISFHNISKNGESVSVVNQIIKSCSVKSKFA